MSIFDIFENVDTTKKHEISNIFQSRLIRKDPREVYINSGYGIKNFSEIDFFNTGQKNAFIKDMVSCLSKEDPLLRNIEFIDATISILQQGLNIELKINIDK